MRSFKTSFLLIFSLLFVSFLKAEIPNTNAGQSPPIAINIGDTNTVIIQKLELQSSSLHYSSVAGIIEDTTLSPCDILFFKSGKLEYCKIIEITPTTVTYKMCDNTDGLATTANKSNIHKIRYGNGEEEIFTADKTTKNAFVRARKDPLAKLSLIFGLSSAAIVVLFGIAFIPLILAGLILGIISLIKIGKRKGELRGKGSALVGIILCGAIILLILALI